jgi:hypothetical protein
VRTLSKMVKKQRRSSLWSPGLILWKCNEVKWEGVRRKKKNRQIVYRQSGERSAEKAEAKFSQTESAIKHIFSKKLSAQCYAEYFVFGSSGY